MKNRAWMSICMFALALTGTAYAQLAPQRVKIDFPFNAGGKVLPAGNYELSHATAANPWVTLRQTNGTLATQLHVITQLGRTSDMSSGTRLVFDKVGEQRILSEVWLYDQDGLLVRSTKARHSHDVVGDSTVVTASK